MREIIDRNPAFNVRDEEYHRLLGYPRVHELSERARELAAWARAWYRANGRPWTYTRQVQLGASGEGVLIDGQQFESAHLREHLKHHKAEGAVLVAVSAGEECEEHARQLWNEGKPDEYFFLEVFGSAVVEELVATTSGRLCDVAAVDGRMAVPHYSPGYAGWDVVDQEKLLSLITREMTSAFPGPLEVLQSGMLKPKKSMLAVFGLAKVGTGSNGSRRATPCESCSFSPCQFRRAPYRHDPAGAAAAREAAAPAPAMVKGYTTSVRALKKWATERVNFTHRADGTLEAVFRFDGTTCSNMGRPIAFDYRVVLSGSGPAARILESSCGPAPGDTGHQFTCAYLDDPDMHLREVAADRPLLGRPLNDVLGWERAPSPSGCHCGAEGRIHKWGLALEAIHYAIEQGRVPQNVS